MLKKHFSICEIKIKIKTTTIGLKNELKYSPMSEGNKNNIMVNFDKIISWYQQYQMLSVIQQKYHSQYFFHLGFFSYFL